MFCPMANRLNLAYLLAHYPSEYEKFMKMCKDTEAMFEKRTGKKHSAFNGNSKYNAEYVDRNVREKYLPKLLELER